MKETIREQPRSKFMKINLQEKGHVTCWWENYLILLEIGCEIRCRSKTATTWYETHAKLRETFLLQLASNRHLINLDASTSSVVSPFSETKDNYEESDNERDVDDENGEEFDKNNVLNCSGTESEENFGLYCGCE